MAAGGETTFPAAGQKVEGEGWSDCARGKVAVRPVRSPVRRRQLDGSVQKRGDALMFYALQPDLSLDYKSRHSSCPVLEGEKWAATVWIHVSPFV